MTFYILRQQIFSSGEINISVPQSMTRREKSRSGETVERNSATV